MPDEEAHISKVPNLHGRHIRICGRHKPEGIGALPGEVSVPAKRLLSSGGDKMGTEKSAEVIVGGIDHHRRTKSKFKGRNLNCIMEEVIGKRTEMFKSYIGSMGRNPGVKI